MSHGVKYRVSYYRKSGGQTTVDILERGYSSTITNLLAAGNPLEIALTGDSIDIFKSTLGTGGKLRVITTPLQLVDLYTEDPQKYIVRIFDGIPEEDSNASSDGGGDLLWQGFVTPEIFTTSYSNPNRDVSIITFNDGMSVLDTIQYTADEIGTLLSGKYTLGQVFRAILNKLELEFYHIYSNVNLATDVSFTKTNLLRYAAILNENFIDENIKAVSCRKVLDSIIGGLGLVMQFRGEDIYLINPIHLHDSTKGKIYDTATFLTELSVSIGGYLHLSGSAKDISWRETGAILDMCPSKSEATVKYDPYNFFEYSYDFNLASNWTSLGTFSDQTGFWTNTSVVFKNWTHSGDTDQLGAKEIATSDPTYMLMMDHWPGAAAGTGSHIFTIPRSYICGDNALAIKLGMQVWIQTKSDDYNIYSDASPYPVYQVRLLYSIKVGDKYWKDDHWEAGATGNYKNLLNVRQEGISDAQFVDNNSSSRIDDRWTEAKQIIALPLTFSGAADFPSGDIVITIYNDGKFVSNVTAWMSNPSTSFIRYVFMKDVKVEIVDAGGINIGNNGVEDSAVISTNLTGKDPFSISTTSGIGTYGVSKAAFRDEDGLLLAGFYQSGSAQRFSTSEIILQNYLSQYKIPRWKIVSGTLDVQDYLLDVLFKLIKDEDHAGERAFMIVSGTYIDREEIISGVEMIEITKTKEDIYIP